MARFESIESGADRRVAQALLNNYNARIKAWQREIYSIKNVNEIQLSDYLSFTDEEIAELPDSDAMRIAIENRLYDIEERVEIMRQRMRFRNTSQSSRAAAKAAIAGKQKRGRGRPKENLLTFGQYVYFAVGYNHGLGAFFLGYGAAEENASFEPTHIQEWEEI